MTRAFSPHTPLALRDGVKTQYAALCFRVRKGEPQFLLITSRGAKRWIVPKGWPIKGKPPEKTAAQEAWEEAGVKGRVGRDCIGLFSYRKWITGKNAVPCVALVFPLEVKSLEKEFPEAGQRRRKWFSRKKAAARVQETELAELIRNFDPRHLRR